MTEAQATSNKGAKKQGKDPLRDTLNLPKTSFAMKANLVQSEPHIQARWERLGLYEKITEKPGPRGTFVFHDGPPFANGRIHMGHLLNKVLKDIVVRSRSMAGYRMSYVPGWDCHGLPIEHKVMKDLGEKAKSMVPVQIRKRCQDHAAKFIKAQMQGLKRLGTLADYEHPYLTMAPQFEADTLEVFALLVEHGLVYRALKPVHWSIANQTALAEAELEYETKKDTSVYVLFEVEDVGCLPDGMGGAQGTVHLMIWTTTPWTLPANMAVAVAPKETYGLYQWKVDGRPQQVVFAEALSDQVFKARDIKDANCLGTCTGQALIDAGLTYKHPFIDRQGKVVGADYVTVEDGCGLVHTAPGHGHEDYLTGLKEGLEVYCPVQADGTYDATVPEWLRGLLVWDANEKIVQHLRDGGQLYHAHAFEHSYPHDWRSKTPTIFRATEQWFIPVDQHSDVLRGTLREAALRTTNDVKFYPAWGQSRLQGMLEARPDWCISRQRSWGLPIPVFLAGQREPLLTPRSVRAVAEKVRQQGGDAWFKEDVTSLLSEYRLLDDPDAPAWLREAGEEGLAQLEKSTDTFDVWFESGSSWNSVLRARKLGYPADLYLEGSDQHRGWFHTSLLLALGATGQAPYKALLTHGFLVDAQGRKMSKSLGNVIDVEELISKFGADICRWWAGSLNFSNDAKADWSYFKTASDEYRKVRNTVRFCLGNLFDFNPKTDRHTFTPDDAGSVDAWVLNELKTVIDDVTEAYDVYAYRKVRDRLFNFCNDTLSTVYMAAIKDRLYCEKPNSVLRRRSQTALFAIADALIKLMAPVLAHTADEAYRSLYDLTDSEDACVHLGDFPHVEAVPLDPQWGRVMMLRAIALKALETAKEQGVSNPLDAGLVFTVKVDEVDVLSGFSRELTDLCGVSRVSFESEGDGVAVQDLREEPRCERSWKRDGTVKKRQDSGRWLSERDADAVVGLL